MRCEGGGGGNGRWVGCEDGCVGLLLLALRLVLVLEAVDID